MTDDNTKKFDCNQLKVVNSTALKKGDIIINPSFDRILITIMEKDIDPIYDDVTAESSSRFIVTNNAQASFENIWEYLPHPRKLSKSDVDTGKLPDRQIAANALLDSGMCSVMYSLYKDELSVARWSHEFNWTRRAIFSYEYDDSNIRSENVRITHLDSVQKFMKNFKLDASAISSDIMRILVHMPSFSDREQYSTRNKNTPAIITVLSDPILYVEPRHVVHNSSISVKPRSFMKFQTLEKNVLYVPVNIDPIMSLPECFLSFLVIRSE